MRRDKPSSEQSGPTTRYGRQIGTLSVKAALSIVRNCESCDYS